MDTAREDILASEVGQDGNEDDADRTDYGAILDGAGFGAGINIDHINVTVTGNTRLVQFIIPDSGNF